MSESRVCRACSYYHEDGFGSDAGVCLLDPLNGAPTLATNRCGEWRWREAFASNSTSRVKVSNDTPKPPINDANPSHYADMDLEPIEVIRAMLTPEEYRGYCKGQVLRYGMRQGRKAGTDDAVKARVYMRWMNDKGDDV